MAKYALTAKGAKFLQVIWYDAADARDTWVKPDTDECLQWMLEPAVVISYGYLVSKNKWYVVLAADLCNDTMVGRVTKIPTPWILSIKRIRTPRIRRVT